MHSLVDSENLTNNPRYLGNVARCDVPLVLAVFADGKSYTGSSVEV